MKRLIRPTWEALLTVYLTVTATDLDDGDDKDEQKNPHSERGCVTETPAKDPLKRALEMQEVCTEMQKEACSWIGIKDQ
ncbi:MAG TPA: hypothetical protein VFB12_16285 [Ktedonobacteraceae bacterium]|nr:hypothetical protein [Ktedonobacteraceae bacterium]